jgi:hypothetical protein
MSAARRRFQGVTDWARWNKSQELHHLYASGDWAAVLEIVDAEIAELERGLRHYLEPEWRIPRARIRFARADTAGAISDAAAGVERARAAGDAQLLIPSLALQASLFARSDRPEAQAVAAELVDSCRRTPLDVTSDWFPEASLALVELGRAADVEAIAETAPTPTPWLDAGRALADGRAVEAAEIFAEMGALPWEAEARLEAAKRGGDGGLDDAVAFFGRVEATAFLREAERLLATSRSA